MRRVSSHVVATDRPADWSTCAAVVTNEDGGSAGTPFLTKLFDLVSDPASAQYITWVATGRTMLIVDAAGLAREILPKHWRHNNVRSFFRQLNAYGFQRSSGYLPGNLQFFHENFIRGRRDLLSQITRGGHSRKRAFDDTEDADSLDSQVSAGIAQVHQRLFAFEASFMQQLSTMHSALDKLLLMMTSQPAPMQTPVGGLAPHPGGQGHGMPCGIVSQSQSYASLLHAHELVSGSVVHAHATHAGTQALGQHVSTTLHTQYGGMVVPQMAMSHAPARVQQQLSPLHAQVLRKPLPQRHLQGQPLPPAQQADLYDQSQPQPQPPPGTSAAAAADTLGTMGSATLH